MRLIVLMIARNEEWVIGESLRAALRWCDAAIVMNHASTDGTAARVEEVQREHPGRIQLLHQSDPTWREMRDRQATLDAGRDFGGTHFAIVDADEMLTANLIRIIRHKIESLKPGELLSLPWLCCWRSLRQYRKDGSIWSRSFASVAFKDSPELHWETRDGYDFHHRSPFGITNAARSITYDMGGLLHFQHASWRRLTSKQCLYQMVETVRWGGQDERFTPEAINARYNPTVNEDQIQLSPLPEHWVPPELAMVDVSAEPWQEAEAKRLWAEHGAAKFAGLNLFGVVG